MHPIDVILNRRSVKKYQNKKVPWDNIAAILQCALNAPQAGNIYNNKFITVRSPEKINSIAGACHGQYWISTAPVVIVVVSEPEHLKHLYGTRGEKLFTIQNAAACTMNMILAAEFMGLSTCWVGAFDEDKLRGILGMPEEVNVMTVLPLGYADEKPPKPGKPNFKNNCYHERFWAGSKMPPYGYYSVEVEKAVKATQEAVKKIADNTFERLKEKVLRHKK
ncbi:MAG: nitroreductase family protein [Nanoarchaeota archaeon]|nr:nitroreductase family protein [Nanoarchaeota archaeon]